MGHHISKQQNRQMSDEHQMMNRTKTPLEPTTSSNRAKSNSLSQKLKTKKHSEHPNDAKVGFGNKNKTLKHSANHLTKSQECSAGSVVITIRLLKMESNTKDIEAFTNMNALHSGSSVHLTTDKSETINNNENNMNANVVSNTTNIPNDDDKHLNNNNNLCEIVDKKTDQTTTFNSLNENSDFLSMFNQTNEMINKNSIASVQCNRINSVSENLNCDTISVNISSLFNRSELLMPSDTEPDIVAEKILNIESTPIPAQTRIQTPTSTSTSQQTAILGEPTISQKILRDFFPTGLISTVSPYPHHIPIANIKSECNNSDNNQHPVQSHQSKSHGNCCNKQTTTTTTTHKDAKETKAKKPNWSIKFNCTKLKSSANSLNTANEASVSNSNGNTTNSNCTNSLKEPTSMAAALVLDKSTVFSTNAGNVFVVTMDQRQLDLARLTPDEYAIDEDCDKKARIQRAIEIAEGVEPPPGFISTKNIKPLHSITAPHSELVPTSVNSTNDTNGNNAGSKINAHQWHMLCSNPQTLRLLNDFHNLLQTTDEIPRIHSQVDYIHCLVPDLKQITNCSYYWGKMDRYEAERLLENKPEGTFLLRDSAQEEFLFSVSFRKYGRSLHARIEQFNHKFSFDVHDPGVYTANTVTGLLEHYKDPACVMFFEPALTLPLNRKFAYSLQQLCRATIVSHTTYDGINEICLPRKLKSYLKEYHYRQRVKVRRFDESNYGAT